MGQRSKTRTPGPSPRRRRLSGLAGPLADKLMDAGNLALGGLLVAQLLGNGPLDWRIGILGFGMWLGALALGSFLLYFGREDD